MNKNQSVNFKSIFILILTTNSIYIDENAKEYKIELIETEYIFLKNGNMYHHLIPSLDLSLFFLIIIFDSILFNEKHYIASCCSYDGKK